MVNGIIEIDEDYFMDQPRVVPSLSKGMKRPSMPVLTSNASVLSNTTTALFLDNVDTHHMSNTMDRRSSTSDEVLSKRKSSPTMSSTEPDLAQTLSSMLSETTSSSRTNTSLDSPKKKEPKQDSEMTSEAQVGDAGAASEHDQLKHFLTRKKHFMMLSSGGKPIYSRHGDGQIVTSYMGILQAIMGFYQETPTPDSLQSFMAGEMKVVVLVKGPIYLVTISSLGETDRTLRNQLDFLYDVVVSTLTSTNMTRLFDRGDNFDLGRQLVGTEKFMNKICDQFSEGSLQLDTLLGGLSIFRLRSTIRARIESILARHRPDNQSSLLYAMIAVDRKLVSILRPKGHSLYPADLRLIFETVWGRGIEEGQDYWLPLCLPKFNSSGYLHTFVSLMAPSVALIMLSADKDDFFRLQAMKDSVAEKLGSENLLRDLIKARFSQISTKLVGLHDMVEHFVYKSRSRVQYISPPLDPVQQRKTKDRRSVPCVTRQDICRIYETLQVSDSRRKTIQIQHFDVSSTQTQDLRVMALSWATQHFELFVIAKPSLKSGPEAERKVRVRELIGAANVIQQFVKQEERRIWLDDGSTF